MTALEEGSETPARALGAPASAGQVLKKHIVPVYAPAMIYAIGQGAVTPMIAVAAHELGANYAMAAFIAGLPAVGVLVGDVPAGAFVARVGEKRGMILSALVTALCCLVVVLTNNLQVLTVTSVVMGAASSVFLLARHSMLTELVEPQYRARALAVLAGTYRLGITIGPFTTAVLITHFGAISTYAVQAIAAVAVIGYLLVAPDPERVMKPQHVLDQPMLGMLAMFRQQAASLARVGGAMAILMMLRNTMVVIIPLWGLAIDVPAAQIALAVGISGLLQLLLTYASGQIADAFGRMWVAVPVTVGIAVGHIALLGAVNTPTFFAATILLAIANGVGGGIMMTIGSDLAPPGRASEFLGLWRLINDAGGAVSPFVLSGATAVVSLGFAATGLGVVGLAGAFMLWRWMPRYLDDSLL